MRLSIIGLFCLLLTQQIQAVPIERPCVSFSLFSSRIVQFHKNAQVEHFVGSEAQDLIIFYNSVPPLTQIKADEVAIVRRPDNGFVSMILFRHGCSIDWNVIRRDIVEGVLQQFRANRWGQQL